MSGNVWYISVSKKKLEFKKYPSKQKNKKTVKKLNQKSTNSSKKLLINLILASSLIFFLNVISAAEINDTFHINLQTTFSNGTIEAGTFTLAFNITESSDSSCLGPIVYNHSVQKTTDTRGIISLYLPTIGSDGGNLSALSFDKQYYLCYYRDDALKDVSQLGRVPYAFRATQVNLSEISVDSNLIMPDYNISADYGFFNFLGSLTNRVTSLFVQDIDVSGDIDVNGGWMNDGLTISGGDIYAQTVYVYNITSLNVTKQNLTIVDDMIVYGNTELKKNLTVDTDTLFVDSNTDRVGIGIISPTHELTVIGTVNATSFIGEGSQITNITDMSGTNVSLNYGYNGSSWLGLRTTYDGILKIKAISEYAGVGWSVSGTYVYNDTAGVTIGIGTATPQNELNVIGDINFTELIYGNGSQLTGITTTETDPLWTGNETNVARTGNCPAGQVVMNTTTGGVECTLASATFETNVSILYGKNTSSSLIVPIEVADSGALKLSVTDLGEDVGWINVGTNVFLETITDSVGIGTTSPQNKLNVIGDINFTELIYGNGSQLTGIIMTETDPLWTGNETNVARTGNCPAGQVVMNTTTSGVQCITAVGDEVDPLWTGNQSLYYLKSNPFNFWNSTFALFNKTYADTLYLTSYTETDPYWTGNQSLYYLKNNPFSFYNSTTDPLDTIAEWQDLCNDCVGTTDISDILDASHITDIYLFNNGDTATGNYTFDSPTFHIDSTNNRIGVGTASPSHTLSVMGGVNLNNSFYVNETTGYVGIGTTSPDAPLHFYRSGNELTYDGTEIFILQDSAGSQESTFAIISASTKQSIITFGDEDDIDIGRIQYGHGTDSMKFFTNALERLRIDSSGNVDFFDNNLLNINDIGTTADEIDDVYIGSNQKIYFGDSQESSIYYNGTHLIFD